MQIDAIKIGILCISDSPRANQMLDSAAKEVEKVLKEFDVVIVERKIVPCDLEEIEWELKRLCEYVHIDLVLTLGAIGLGPKDVTPDCTLSIIRWRLEGIELAIRLALMERWPQSILSRAVSGVQNRTLVINLPEEPDQVNQCLEAIAPILPLAVYSAQSRPAEDE